MNKFFLLGFCSLLLSSCNYNYHLGKKLEQEGKFEEASVEYSKPYLQNSSSVKYKEAYERNAEKTVEVLKNVYQKQIINQNFFSAYKILEEALRLNTQDFFFQKEQEKWYFVLLAGKIQYPSGKDINNLIFGEKIYPVVRFYSPKTEKEIETIIGINGDFFLEDLLYEPDDIDYIRYTISTIGFKYLPFQASNANIDEDNFAYFHLVNFYQPKLLEHQGQFLENEISLPQTSFDKQNYWYPNRGITYRSQIENQKILIESSSPEVSFLPLTFSKNKQRVFLNFGTIDFKKSQKSFLWAVAQVSQIGVAQVIEQSYYYQVYKKTLQHSYSIIRR